MTASLPSRYFDDLYATDPDPWGFATSAYERDKYDATIAALPGRIDDGLEIGCSIGVLTQRLAPHCERLLAIDPAEWRWHRRANDARRSFMSFSRACGFPRIGLRGALISCCFRKFCTIFRRETFRKSRGLPEAACGQAAPRCWCITRRARIIR